jgi:predicted dehydrogenase
VNLTRSIDQILISPVVCEKPFTPTTQEADELVAIAKKNNKQLAVFQSTSPPTHPLPLHTNITDRRWDADFVTLSKLVKNGSLGRISEYETHFDRHRPEEPAADAHAWKNKVIPGGSAIYDLGAHLLDQAVHLLGLPARVTGFIGSARASNTSSYEDAFTVLLHYANGTMVTAKATVVSPEDEQLRFWVRGDKGSFKKVSIYRIFSAVEPVLIFSSSTSISRRISSRLVSCLKIRAMVVSPVSATVL